MKKLIKRIFCVLLISIIFSRSIVFTLAANDSAEQNSNVTMTQSEEILSTLSKDNIEVGLIHENKVDGYTLFIMIFRDSKNKQMVARYIVNHAENAASYFCGYYKSKVIVEDRTTFFQTQFDNVIDLDSRVETTFYIIESKENPELKYYVTSDGTSYQLSYLAQEETLSELQKLLAEKIQAR